MTKLEQRRFIRELIATVRADLLRQSVLIPDNWDGHELRQWIADRFQEASWTLRENRSRYREYRRVVAGMGRV
jgi:hypothetical protein